MRAGCIRYRSSIIEQRVGWWPARNGARLKEDWEEDLGGNDEKQGGGCFNLIALGSAGRLLVSVFPVKVNLVDYLW